MPGESKQVEAQPDPYGLKIGIVYDAAPETQELMFQMWKVKNESVLTITYVNGGDISTFGGNTSDIIKYSDFFKAFPLNELFPLSAHFTCTNLCYR
jgi:hypothetical protein